MTATEILEAITAVGGELLRIGDELFVQTAEPLAPELVIHIREYKDYLLPLLPECPQDGYEALTDTRPSPTIAAGDEPFHTPRIARCWVCGGADWGPTAPPVPETLPSGERVQVETWGCSICAIRPGGTRPAPTPETLPPGSVESACPQCGKPYRLFVPGSPHIEGEPDKAVLICGQCGNIELACSDCHRTNVVTDAANRWVNGENVLVDCIEVNRIGIPG